MVRADLPDHGDPLGTMANNNARPPTAAGLALQAVGLRLPVAQCAAGQFDRCRTMTIRTPCWSRALLTP